MCPMPLLFSFLPRLYLHSKRPYFLCAVSRDKRHIGDCLRDYGVWSMVYFYFVPVCAESRRSTGKEKVWWGETREQDIKDTRRVGKM